MLQIDSKRCVALPPDTVGIRTIPHTGFERALQRKIPVRLSRRQDDAKVVRARPIRELHILPKVHSTLAGKPFDTGGSVLVFTGTLKLMQQLQCFSVVGYLAGLIIISP